MSDQFELSNYRVPGWAKLLVGGVAAGVILFKTPILEIFYLFAYIVIIPVVFIIAMGLTVTGASETFDGAFTATSKRLMNSLKKAREEAYPEAAETTDEVPAPPKRTPPRPRPPAPKSNYADPFHE